MSADYLVPDPYNSGAWLVCKDGADQSWIDPADPARLEFDYMRRIAWLIDAWAGERGLAPGARLRVVHIGGAGMSLARWLAVTRPTSAQIVLEPDVALTAAVRQVAPLPPHSGIKVRASDGRSGLAAMPDDYADVIILDAFDQRQVPSSLVGAEFWAEVRRVLHADGLATANFIDAHPHDWARRAVATIDQAFGTSQAADTSCLLAEASAFKSGRVTNLVVGASAVPLPLAPLVRWAAGAVFPARLLAGDDLRHWLAGARPFCDADAEPSPPRAEGELTWYG